MKKILLLSLCLLIGAWTLSAQQTTFIIDNKTVEDFDGSQLKDKTIKDYTITTRGSGRNAVTVHTITTARSPFSVAQVEENSVSQTFQKKAIYVIDGEVSKNESVLKSLSPEEIASISVLKENSPEAKEYGENVTVILIQTKKGIVGLLEALKGLPGVKVEPDGSISVNGQPVKTITINGRSYSVAIK